MWAIALEVKKKKQQKRGGGGEKGEAFPPLSKMECGSFCKRNLCILGTKNVGMDRDPTLEQYKP